MVDTPHNLSLMNGKKNEKWIQQRKNYNCWFGDVNGDRIFYQSVSFPPWEFLGTDDQLCFLFIYFILTSGERKKKDAGEIRSIYIYLV